MNEDLQALIEYRLTQASESLEEARVLLEGGMSFRSVMNRLYYAMFYAVLALLHKRRLGTSKHTGAISLFDREFIKSGLFDKELSKALHRAFELRQRGDYLAQTEVQKEDVDEMFPKAINFVNQMRQYLLGRK